MDFRFRGSDKHEIVCRCPGVAGNMWASAGWHDRHGVPSLRCHSRARGNPAANQQRPALSS